MTPLHLACSWGQERVVSALVEQKCELNVQDAEGNTPLHVAIFNQHARIIEILIRQSAIDLKIKNTAGQSPFAAALLRKNNSATALILKKESKAAEQTDAKGGKNLILF
jgi:ankyrin repeat protein